MTCFPLRGKCRRQYVQANWIFRSVATLKSSETPFRAQRDGACQRLSNNAQYTVVLPPQPSGQLPRWGAKNVLPLNLITLLRCVGPWRRAAPKGEDCSAPKGHPSAKRNESACAIKPLPYRHPERSRGIFIALRESACMRRGKTMSWCCLTSGDERSVIKISGLRSK